MTSFWQIKALAGGTVNLSGLGTINEPNANVIFEADGSGSQLKLSTLTSFTGGGGDSNFQVTNSATVVASNLTSFSDVNITLDGTGTVATSQWSSILGGGSLTVTGGSYSLAGLTDVNGSSLYAQSGGSLTLPNLTSYNETDSTVFEATGVNSKLNLSALTTLGSMTSFWQNKALAGGTLTLSGLVTINESNANVLFTADGSGSQLSLAALTSFTGGGGDSIFVVTDSATLRGKQSGRLQRREHYAGRHRHRWPRASGAASSAAAASRSLAARTVWPA